MRTDQLEKRQTKDQSDIMEDSSKMELAIETLAVHLGHGSDKATGAIVPPIHLATTFEQSSPGVPVAEYEYSRSGNPTRKLLENAIATLENAKHGLALSSGLAVISLLGSLLEPGAHILSVNDLYGGTKRYFTQILNKYGVETTYTQMTDVSDVKALLRPTTRMLWIETPTNPTLSLVDIKEMSQLAHAHRPDMIVVVDNTFLTPYLQRPLDMGADIVTHSATKYLNGHCDVVMGLLATNNTGLYEKLLYLQNALGAVPSPFDAYMVMRGMRTLHVRMDRHCSNAMSIAQFLAKHPQVETVIYPGLQSHPQHALATKQQRNYGGMVSFRLKGDLNATCSFATKTKVFTLAESLGGVESLIDVPAVMTHGGVAKEEREALGVTDTFIRLSVGLEDVNDLIKDLQFALDSLNVN